MSSKDLAILHQARRMLAQAQEPITFYDILMLVREAEAEGDLPPLVLDTLAHATTLAHLTDGARDTLRKFLRSVSAAHAQERARAEKGVTLRDVQKRVRVPAHAWLSVILNPALSAGATWEPEAVPANIEIVAPYTLGTPAPGLAKATYLVRAKQTGLYPIHFTLRPRVTSQRRPTAGGPASKRMFHKPCTLEFWLIAEAPEGGPKEPHA